MKFLLVDDDEFALKFLEMQLRRLGCDDIVCHSDAREALLVLTQPTVAIDLLFCDLRMPEVDGVEFVRHLAQIGFKGWLVLVSGTDVRVLQAVDSLAQSHGIRVLGACRKPLAPAQLADLLARAADTRDDSARPAARELATGELQAAIASDRVLNHYQPKVRMQGDGALVGVEALVRLRSTQGALVFPDRFIVVAERHRLIDTLMQSVTRLAIEQSAVWRRVGLDLPVAVNVSMDNLWDLDLPDRIAEAVAAAGISPGHLTFEVTESRLMSDPRAVLDILSRLRLKGFGLSIDDFGTGHSSLAQLRDLPFSELKLDRSFVRRADQDAARRAIVEAALSMAHRLGMTVVAEGVENQAEWALLAALGCDVAQGYFIARPMAGDEIPAWRDAWPGRCPALGITA